MAIDLSKIDYSKFDKVDPLLKTSMSEALRLNPDKEAHINDLSKESGVPRFAVAANPEKIKSHLDLSKIDYSKMTKVNPNTADFLTDPNKAAVAHDDVTTLESIEDTLTRTKEYGSDIKQSFEHGQNVVESSELGLKRLHSVFDGTYSTGDNPEAQRIVEINKTIIGGSPSDQYGFLKGAPVAAAEMLPIMGSILYEGAYSAAVGGTAGMMMGSVIPGVGTTGGGITGAVIGGRVGTIKGAFDLEAGLAFNEFIDLKDPITQNTLDPKIAASAAVAVGGINAALESFSLMTLGRTVTPVAKQLIKTKVRQALGTETGKQILMRLTAAYGTSVATETVTEGLQEFSNIVMGEMGKYVDKDSFTDQDIGTALDNIFSLESAKRVGESSKKGGQASLLFAGTGTAISAYVDFSQKQKLSENEQVRIDKIAASSEISKLRGRDKESFKQFVEKSDGENNTHVFIDASQAALYLQTKTQEEIDNDPVLTMLNGQIGEAAALDGEIQIPIADFTADVVGTEHFNQLRDSMTLSDQTVSPFRQAQEKQETASYVRNLMAEAQENTSQYVEAQNIFDQVKQQLVDSGRVTPANATIMSQVVPAWATAQAARSGKSVQQVYADSGLVIEGPLTGEQQRLQDELKVFTQDMNYDETGQIRRDENFKKWFGDSQVVDEAGEPLVVYHGTDETFEEFDTEKIGTKIIRPHYGTDIKDGFFFAKMKKVSSRYGNNVMPLHVSIKNPAPSYKEYVENEQYDGFINSKIVIARNPTQIKSVFNRGTFDPTDPNIMRQDLVESVSDLQSKLIDQFDGLKLSITSTGDTVTLNKVIIPENQRNTGVGTQVLDQIVSWADNNGKTITLTPSKDFGGTIKRLKEFYKRAGFVENKGKNKDFEISDSMYRNPQKVERPVVIDKEIADDLISEIDDFSEIDDNGLITVYHRTSKENANKIRKTGVMTPKEDGIFFSTKEDGQAEGFGDEIISFKIPADMMQLDDIFDDEAHLRIPADANKPNDVSKLLFQPTSEDAPGARGYYDPSRSLIRLTEASDLSTFLHEFAHFMYEMEVTGDTEMNQSINNWFKRNSVEVAKEANKYMTKGDGPVEQSATPGFELLPNGNHVGYKVMAVNDNGLLQSGANSRLTFEAKEGVEISMPGNGVFLSNSAEYVIDYYSELAENEVLLKVEFKKSDVVDGESSFEDREPEIGVSSVKIMEVTPLESSEEFYQGIPENEDLETFTQNFILDRMTEDLKGGQAYGSVEVNGESTNRSSSNILWWRAKEVKKWIKESGTDLVYDDLSNKKYFLNVIAKIKAGKKLTEKQTRVKQYVDHIADQYLNEDTETIQNVEFAKLDREGFEFIAPISVPVGDTTEGSQLLIIHENGSLEVLTNEGRKEQNGDIIFSSNITDELLEVDEFDVIENVNGFKGDVTLEYKSSPLDNAAVPGPQGTVTPDDVRIFLDEKSTGDEAKDKAIRRAVHEQFARGFETYLMEGKAPSIEMRNAFRTFARWLTQIYKSIKGDLNVNLDAEMRQVFDRLLATEEQIAAAEARAKFDAGFTDATVAGMTEEQFAKYQADQEKVKDVQSETLRDKLIEQLTRQTKKWWKEEKQDIIDVEIDKLKKDRVYVARDRLKNGDIKLDFATTKEISGETKTDKRGRTTVRVSSKLKGMTIKENQGLHPDEAAAIFGYGSGSEMLNDLITAPTIDEVASTRAEAEMVERHGDMMNDGTIERAADDAVQNEERGKVFLKELKALAKGTAVPDIDRETIKSIAAEKIGKLSFREIFPGKYRKAEIRAAQESARMLAEGNREGAAAAKMRQVMNYYLGMEASKAKADTMKIVDRMNRYNKKKVRVEIMKGDQSYMDQIDKILNRFEFRKSASLKSVEDINTWLKNKNENEGDALILSNAVLDEGYITHWKNVPYGDMRGISDSVKNIEHVARYANKIKLMGEQVDYAKVKQEWLDVIEQNKTRFDTKESRDLTADATAETKNETVRRWASQLTKVPFIALWLDGGERVGLSHQLLMQKLTDALDAKMKLTDEVMTPVIQLIENRTKEDKARHNRKIWVPEIGKNVLGSQVLSVALNTGNAGNLKKMLLGEGWADPEIETDISFDNPKLQAILQHMNKNDWILVQKIWDQMELLYPQLEEVHFKTTGIRPPKVIATPIENEFGTFKGGYYPVKYSRKRSHKAEKNAEKAEAEVSSMFNNTASIQASVNVGATNERTGFYDRINLSLEVIPEHFNETIHYITHHEAVRQTNKLIQDPQIASAITAVLGESEYNILKPWLNDVAKDGRQQPTKTYIDEIFQQLRTGTTLGVMGFKATTGIMQVFGLFTTAAELGTKTTLQGIYDTIGRSFYMKSLRKTLGSTDDMQTGMDFANERSKILPHRVKTMDREMSNAMKSLQGKRGILPAVQEASMKHIALIQLYMVDLPTWIAAYDKTISETGDETKAIQYADWAIENLQGSGATKDMSAILRNQSKITTTFTMFMTFFSSLGNLGRDTVKGAKSGLYSPTSVAAKLMFLYTIPVFMEMLMRGELDEPDDDDDRLSSLMTGLALYPVTSIPFIRDVASGLFSGFGYNSSPVASVIEKGIMGYKQIGERSFTDEEITKSALKNASKLTGATLGIPGVNQMWATGEHLYDVIEEGEDFTFRELFFGPKRK